MEKFRPFFTCIILLFNTFYSAQVFIGNRSDFRDETIYFVMTTRFNDGDKTNNAHCWDGNNPGDPAWRGDFKGLIDRLDYIKALGFTSIWITPIAENASGYDYHGYHAMNFNKVDTRYTSEGVGFQQLIDAVHAKGMKIILDIVLNHTGNFGEETLAPMFKKEGNLSNISCMTIHPNSQLPSNYSSLQPSQQYQARLAQMKNTDNVNHDNHNRWHHFGNFNWDDITAQWAQIAGDCVDLNTENPEVYNYLVNSYTQYINMGVDGFRIDTGRHISRLVFNKVFNNAFHNAATAVGKPNFFMFSEICTRVREVWNRGIPAISTPFYTWKDSQSYAWSGNATPYSNIAIFESNFNTAAATLTNQNSCIQNYNDNMSISNQPTSDNYKLNGNNYHTPDLSMNSGLGVIDFPMHWNYKNASDAYNLAIATDQYYNDPTYNVVYVDSHDYAPDGAPENQRFAQPQDTWAENLSLMYTFRGVPCLYYGSEIEFKKGMVIDNGPNTSLINTGRAYYGGYITGNINVSDFGTFDNATGNIGVTLKHPLALHIQRLNKLRHTIPALRKGQYSTSDITKTGVAAFKRRYTDSSVDSFVLVTISGNATFNNIPNGTYTDAITGDIKTVTNGSLTATCPGKGNARIYVLATSLTPAPGKVGTDGKYLYASSPVIVNQGSYDGQQEASTDDPDTGGDTDPDTVITPQLCIGEKAIFFKKPDNWAAAVNLYVYDDSFGSTTVITSAWPGNAMTSLGNNYYKYTFFENINSGWKVLFNASGQQTPGGGQPGWKVINGAIYQQASSESGAILQTLAETDCSMATQQATNQLNTIHFYPNPAKSSLNIINLNKSEKNTTIKIYSPIGNLVKTISTKTETALQIDVSHFAKGVYMVEAGKESFRFIKE